jgi:NTP pyrophosphatase (non-canonical NTP hydrolase)
MDINELVKKSHATALEKGWWDGPRSPLEVYALVVSEVGEAIEDARDSRPELYYTDGKPCGELSEIADVFIRLADYCGREGWDLDSAIEKKMEYNNTRPYRHGGKKY